MTARSALVTGGGTRVGAAIARELVARGYDVLVHYGSNAKGADEVVAGATKLGRRAASVRADLYDRSAIARLAEEASAFCGGALDLLVHGAANFDRAPPEALDAALWDRAMALNVTAPYLLTIALAPALRAAKGAVVALACISAERPFKNYVPYSVSKAALVHLVKGLALALAPDVRVNAVSPGTVLPPDDYDAEKVARIAAKIPLEHVGTAEDAARAVAFLAEQPFVTGQVLAVDGGRTLV